MASVLLVNVMDLNKEGFNNKNTKASEKSEAFVGSIEKYNHFVEDYCMIFAFAH